ncbi:MAG: insulinase family protein [Gammaproteobacteria bacterium AqS3]|nr:insulinase family protein [Gammaproteobacteria bacterium AqS3]
MKSRLLLTGLLLAALPLSAQIPEVPYTKMTLDNGLTLIVHEDNKVPIVAVNIWYAVGSRDEQIGRTGFAHLFEHLMFNGSENYDNDYFFPLRQIGATDLNGTTNSDRTNYFQTVPKAGLDRVLWMESDRMGHLLGAITQDKLDEQRGVVQNEKRQRENAPYGRVWGRVAEEAYPSGHPYSWSTIGSMEDLNAATLDDVHQWFKDHYGPNNAVLVLAGDISAEEALAKVERYFGHIPPSQPRERLSRWVAPIDGPKNDRMIDDVPEAQTYMVWNGPPVDDLESGQLSVVASVLADGANSRLYRRLIEPGLATNVNAFYWARQLGGQLWITARAKDEAALGRVKAEIQREINALRARGINSQELARTRPSLEADALRALERVGGFGGKSDIFASSEVYMGDPDARRRQFNRVLETPAAQYRGLVQKWLDQRRYTLDVIPQSQLSSSEAAVDRSSLPKPEAPNTIRLPELQRFTLAGGIPVTLIRRSGAPTFEMNLMFRAGRAADAADKVGLGDFTARMLRTGGSGSLDFKRFDAELNRYGARISTRLGADTTYVSVSGLTRNLNPTLSLAASMLGSPRFDAREIEVLRNRTLAAIDQEMANPSDIALRTLPRVLFGPDHPYAKPIGSPGDRSVIEGLKREDLLAYRRTWLRPDNLHIAVVGDVSAADLRGALEGALRRWRASGSGPVMEPPKTAPATEARVYLIDRPGAQQSYIAAGRVLGVIEGMDEFALKAANDVFGGNFTARLNMNLREDKSWSYGARTSIARAGALNWLIVRAPVQTDATAPALREIRRELSGFASGKSPASEEELARHRDNAVWSFPGSLETNVELLSQLSEQIALGRPDDYLERYTENVQTLDLPAVNRSARAHFSEKPLVWVIIGDLDSIEKPVRELNLGKVEILPDSL